MAASHWCKTRDDSVADPDLSDIRRRMEGAIDALHKEFAGLRTGRASVGLLEPIQVRSEEHTSKLQSLMRISYAVFCLKKKKHSKQQIHENDITQTQEITEQTKQRN